MLGPDNLSISADWPASCGAEIEDTLGTDAVAIFLQGAGADVNPVTAQVRKRLTDGRPVVSSTEASYYGHAADDFELSVGNRFGGAFEEAEAFGKVVAAEVLRTVAGVELGPVRRVWTVPLTIAADGEPDPSEPLAGIVGPRVPPGTPLEVMLVGIDGPGILIAGQPGELFARSGARLRRHLRHAGVPFPVLVAHANGRRGYLPPADAFPEGGYEVSWARSCGIPADVQDEIAREVLAVVSVREH